MCARISRTSEINISRGLRPILSTTIPRIGVSTPDTKYVTDYIAQNTQSYNYLQ